METIIKILKKFVLSGIWLQPLTLMVFIRWKETIEPQWVFTRTVEDIRSMFFLSLIPPLYVYAETLHGKNKKGKKLVTYPAVNRALMYKKPRGVVFGKQGRKYVCKPLDMDDHVVIIGGSGSGKSSCIAINTLLVNSEASIFAIDIKGELSGKSRKYGDANTVIINPDVQGMFGYDPFYELKGKENDNQSILETMEIIAISLIPLPLEVKDPFWKRSARSLLMGLLIYFYKQGNTDFVSIVDEIMSKPIQETLDEVMENADKHSAEYKCLVQFADLAEETLSGIVSEMWNHIIIFANNANIKYAFKENPLKATPSMLEEGKSIFLSIREEKLSSYYDVIQLIINQVLTELEKRPENAKPILLLIDELPRLVSAGKLEHLMDAVRTLRSRKVTLVLITQSAEALMSAYTENEVTDLISNCGFIEILSAASPKTQRMVTEWCGKFEEKRVSWNGSGSKTKVTTSYQEKNIVESSDLMTLAQSGEAILISPYGYNRIKKAPYYKDRVFRTMATEIKEYNNHIK